MLVSRVAGRLSCGYCHGRGWLEGHETDYCPECDGEGMEHEAREDPSLHEDYMREMAALDRDEG
jgi:DnaJ-class molecular chaperone